ncbi:AAA domain-containing protein [Leifsonia sp. 98AMF]|uniref:AAA family ATPase n=1 Tax=unclassified Leifsonia TaxID=2663824 RepID=UPI00087AC715|nr:MULTISPECIES: AAA family ATPase [unclassified Leifsonia]SDH51791.1 AAA domain-containing protein [Leifsonia sp. 197AMF]SDI86492.1 AAA domain-containing protein [Leifsonia sp. 466MF]SDJ95599.1 AAA domain-containing protein [Leifsonia sp. 157MF]SDN89923.1 AAA domain-containing protein [Leifsonia sp. 509MF]SEN16044.1 AAA domain-containing protein [Leifsonia sp. 467MF]
MPSIEEEIASWVNQRPDWIRILAAQILEAGGVDEQFAESLAADLVAKKALPKPAELSAEDLPTSASGGARVELVSIGDLVNVNALADGGQLVFGESGLTVVYGDNGSGKSGFARLVKDVVGARHRQEILPNAFNPKAPKDQSAVITYRIDGKPHTITWPQGTDPELRQVHFYDEACGDHYLINDTELSYRPSALNVLDQLVEAADMLRSALDRELAKVAGKPHEIPGLTASSAARKFASSLSANTTDQQIDSAVELPADAEAQLATLVQEEGRLQSTNPSTEKTRLTKAAAALDLMADHLDDFDEFLSPAASAKVEELLSNARALRAAADLASKTNFTNEPLEGVGTASWRALWEAAENYSKQVAYHEHDFPYVSDDARCPLCQQPLADDASMRLTRFQEFVHDVTAKRAKEAEAAAQHAISSLVQFEVATVATTNALAAIEAEDPTLADELRLALDTAGLAKGRIGERLRTETEEPAVPLASIDRDDLKTRAESIRQRAEKVDAVAFAARLKEATDAKNEFRDRIELAKHAESLKKDAARQRAERDITAIRNSVSTQPITKQSIALTRTYVNEQVNDRFSRESDRLGLDHVKLDDKGGGKGKLRHKPALLGATLTTKTVRDVLSEGEQTALGLAGLLTEINFDDSKSALVLDDPITSLDHGRREKVARRIAALASKRQVIVFTHDLTFLGDLIRAADEEDVPIEERSIVKDKGVPGAVLAMHPWKAKDAKKRIGDLRADLAKLKKDQLALSTEEYDNRVQLWAGKLSETWERIVRNDVVGKVVDRGTTEVRPKMIKLLAKITAEDNSDFQSGYSQVSKWAPRHDKSEEVNFVAPSIDDMEAELNRAEAWWKKMVAYAN